METQRLEIGVIGCGRLARSVHLPILARMRGVYIKALAEPDSARGAEASRLATGARVYTDWRDLLAGPAMDAALVCTPPALHAEVASATLQVGLHVYVEKPLATCLTDARELLKTWRRTGLVGTMGFNFRYSEPYLAARAAVRSGRLGEIVAARTSFCSAGRDLPEWKRRRASGGGALLDLASHHVDLVRFVLDGEIAEVEAAVHSHGSEADSAALQLRLTSGVLVQSYAGFGSVDEDVFEIYGRSGKLVVDRYHGDLCTGPSVFSYGRAHRLHSEWRGVTRGFRRVTRSPGEPSYRASLEAFVDAVRAGRSAGPTLKDGYISLAVIEAAERAAATGRVAAPEPEEEVLA